MVSREYDKKTLSQLDEAGKQRLLLHRTSVFSNGIIEGISNLDTESQKKIMESCGKICATVTGNLAVAEEIAKLSLSINEKLVRLNESDVWCGRWVYDGDYFESVCSKCGCPLVTEGIVELNGIMCQCSRGWIKTVFEKLLQEDVTVEIVESIGLGGEKCAFRVQPKENR